MLIEKLHLPKKLYDLAKEKGLINADDLLDNINELNGMGLHYERKTRRIINAILLAKTSGSFDETKYFSDMGISIIPQDVSGISIEEALLQIVEEIMGERSKEILRHRFGLSNTKEKTLDDLGQAYGITRERVRQIEAKALATLRRLLCHSFYTDKEKSHVHPELSRAIYDIIALVKEVTIDPVSIEQVKDNVKPLVADEATLSLLIEVAELQTVKSKHEPPIVLAKKDGRAKKLAEAIDIIAPIISETSEPFSVIDLLIEANKRVKKRGHFTAQMLELALSFLKEIEHINGHYQCRTECLRKTTDIAFRFLRNEGPMHFKEIVRYINSIRTGRQMIAERSFTNQLSSDNRFSPLGKSGQWALSELKPEIRNIKDVMVDFLNSTNKPATPTEIYNYVKSKRPVSKSSILIYLNDDNKFSQVSDDKWGLTTWPEAKAYVKPKSQEKKKRPRKTLTQIDKIRSILIEEAIRLNPENIKAKDVVTIINKRLGLGYSNIAPLYTQITKTGVVEKTYSSENELYYKVSIPKSNQWKPLIKQINHDEVAQNVLRALNYYNEDEIDICLLLLSQEFEGVAMSLVHELLAQGTIKSVPTKLAGCIDLLRNNGIVTDQSALNILREQRNERHHGKAPSKSERQALFASAPVLVNIYINYIKFLDEQI